VTSSAGQKITLRTGDASLSNQNRQSIGSSGGIHKAVSVRATHTIGYG